MSSNTTAEPTSFKNDLRGLAQDVSTLRTDVQTLGHDAVGTARSGATELRHRAEHIVDSAQARLEEARKSASTAAHSLTDLMARNPITSIGIAAGVGLLLGLFISRRS